MRQTSRGPIERPVWVGSRQLNNAYRFLDRIGMGTETKVYFGVFDFGDDPGVVTEMMGIEPTTAWVAGERYASPSPNARRTHSRWSLESGLSDAEPLEDHFAALLMRLEAKRLEIDRVVQRFSTRIGVAQYFHEANPQFVLEPDMLRRLAELRLSIYFDQYCLGEYEGNHPEPR